MRHFASPSFRNCHRKLPPHIRQLADKNFKLFKENFYRASLHLKKVCNDWSVRVGVKYRDLGVEVEGGVVWFWTGTHAEYDNLVNCVRPDAIGEKIA